MFEPSVETLRLEQFVRELPEGAFVAYDDIAQATSIQMDVRGKYLLRTACKRAERYYRCDPGTGIELDCPENTMGIVTGKTKRVSRALHRTYLVSTTLSERYLPRLQDSARQQLTALTSLLGAVQAMSRGLSRIYSSRPQALPPPKPQLPEVLP